MYRYFDNVFAGECARCTEYCCYRLVDYLARIWVNYLAQMGCVCGRSREAPAFPYFIGYSYGIFAADTYYSDTSAACRGGNGAYGVGGVI